MTINTNTQPSNVYLTNSKKVYEFNKTQSLNKDETTFPSFEQYQEVKDMLKKNERIGSLKIMDTILNNTELTDGFIKAKGSMSEEDFSHFFVTSLGMQDTIEVQNWEKNNHNTFSNNNDYAMGYFQNISNLLVEFDKESTADNKKSIDLINNFVNILQKELDKKESIEQQNQYLALGEAQIKSREDD